MLIVNFKRPFEKCCTLHWWFLFFSRMENLDRICPWSPCNLETCMWRCFWCCLLRTWLLTTCETRSPVNNRFMHVSVITLNYWFQASPKHYWIQITNSWIKPFFSTFMFFFFIFRRSLPMTRSAKYLLFSQTYLTFDI